MGPAFFLVILRQGIVVKQTIDVMVVFCLN